MGLPGSWISGPRGLLPGRAAHGPTQGAAHDVDYFLDVLLGVTVLRGGPHAALDMVLEDEHRERVDGGTERAGLLEDVHAVFLALDHPSDAADLALDPCEPPHELRLV